MNKQKRIQFLQRTIIFAKAKGSFHVSLACFHNCYGSVTTQCLPFFFFSFYFQVGTFILSSLKKFFMHTVYALPMAGESLGCAGGQ